MFAVWLLVTCSLVATARCDSAQVQIVQLSPEKALNLSYAYLQAQQLGVLPKGMTICMRALFRDWQFKLLFYITNTNNDASLEFAWVDSRLTLYARKGDQFAYYRADCGSSMNRSPFAWNFFCVSYNADTKELKLVTNREVVFSETEDNDVLKLDHSSSAVIFLQSYLTATSIMDFNFWSRSLSTDEISSVLNDCSQDFVSNNKPDYVHWPEVNIITSGDNFTQVTTRPRSDVCSDLEPRETEVFRVPLLFTFKQAFEFCDDLNADFPPISNLTQFEEILKSSRGFDLSLGVWVPVKRSRTEPTKWSLSSKEQNNTDVTVSDRLNSTGATSMDSQDCLSYNASNATAPYQAVSCESLR